MVLLALSPALTGARSQTSGIPDRYQIDTVLSSRLATGAAVSHFL